MVNVIQKNDIMNIVYGLVCFIMLAGCSDSDDSEGQKPLTVTKVNQLLEVSDYHGEGFKLNCSDDKMLGCFIFPSCYMSSGNYSTRTVYGLEDDKIKAFVVSYWNSNCEGEPGLHPTSWSQWRYQLDSLNLDTQEAELTVQLDYYADGFLFDSNKPISGVNYKSVIWIDDYGENRRLCLSEELINPARPLKFMGLVAEPLDSNNCAIEFN